MPDNWKTHSRKMFVGDEVKKFTKAFRDNFVTLIVSSFGLLVALTWNNFWNAWVATLSAQNTLPYKFVLAIIITLIAVIFTYVFSRLKSTK